MSAIAPVAPAPSAPPAAPALPIYRLSVAQYLSMIEHDILTTNDRVELIHGLLVAKMTKHPPHSVANGLLQDVLGRILPTGWCARYQEPITLSDSVPEPDGVVIRGRLRDYTPRHPAASDAALVVEVAESSLEYDRRTKRPLYAAANIPTYWIVNLIDNLLEVYTDPANGDYTTSRVLGPNDEVPVVLDGQEVARISVRDLLP